MVRFILAICCCLVGCTAAPEPSIHCAFEESLPSLPLNDSIIQVSDNRTECPSLKTYWVDPPNISVCQGVNITERRLKHAISSWTDLGYKFGEIRWKRWELQECNSAAFGDILIRYPTQDDMSMHQPEAHLAVTLTHHHKVTNQILGAEIFFVDQAGTRTSHVLEHELGHALGWGHCNKNYHRMNPNTSRLGTDTHGVTFSDYESARASLIVGHRNE
jgi:hypothetical protein